MFCLPKQTDQESTFVFVCLRKTLFFYLYLRVCLLNFLFVFSKFWFLSFFVYPVLLFLCLCLCLNFSVSFSLWLYIYFSLLSTFPSKHALRKHEVDRMPAGVVNGGIGNPKIKEYQLEKQSLLG